MSSRICSSGGIPGGRPQIWTSTASNKAAAVAFLKYLLDSDGGLQVLEEMLGDLPLRLVGLRKDQIMAKLRRTVKSL